MRKDFFRQEKRFSAKFFEGMTLLCLHGIPKEWSCLLIAESGDTATYTRNEECFLCSAEGVVLLCRRSVSSDINDKQDLFLSFISDALLFLLL